MKKATAIRLCAACLLLCTVFLTACGSVVTPTLNAATEGKEETILTPNPVGKLPLSNTEQEDHSPEGAYNKGIVLVKYDGVFDQNVLNQLNLVSAEPLYPGAKWYSVTLAPDADTEETVAYLRELDCFDEVDYDYVMKTEAEIQSIDVSCNPDHGKQKHFDTHHIKEGWDHCLEKDTNPGGSADVVVAVIDTGVDYTHLDLRNNIWINSAEIPDNGRDDDGNGYIDDVYGWDCVGDDKDPMDDNGHGTHVAGIIAAENNDQGGVGVAYNCKIMVLKAGNSSGYFNNSDIAEAVQYAYMNGASVINMSFGGSFISIAAEEALEAAYTDCILVAAAGNDSLCNNLDCPGCPFTGVSYPAALPYVIGVMSVGTDGKTVSGFSNYDHYPYNTVEYEVYAVGEEVYSTWPGNKYATLQGTSMAAPTVAGIAALLRSAYSDREVYSSKFIQSQIVNTGSVNPYTDLYHSVANVYEALTKLPKPSVNLYDYFIDDSTAVHSKNNGNGVIDAGETVRLYISLHNRGGVASDVKVSIDTMRSNDPSLTDPYFTFVNTEITLSDIGTYSVRDSGDKYFEIKVSPDCPNDYPVDFNVRFTYTNGMDAEDATVYTDDGRQKAQFNISRGYCLPAVITEDTVFTNDRLYIVGEDVTIAAGATVTFEEGCEIQFYDDRDYFNSPTITVYGELHFSGTEDNMVRIFPNERNADFVCEVKGPGTLNIEYVDAINLSMNSNVDRKQICVSNSNLKVVFDLATGYTRSYIGGIVDWDEVTLRGLSMTGCYVDMNGTDSSITFDEIRNSFIRMNTGSYSRISIDSVFSNNVFYTCIGPKIVSNATGELNFGSKIIEVANNYFCSSDDGEATTLCEIHIDKKVSKDSVKSNAFSKGYQKYASQVIEGYFDSTGTPIVDVYGSLADPAALWPFVMNVEMFNADGELVDTIGKEEITVRVTFNRPMDTTKDTYATFGTIEPYGDYRIDGEYISDTVWEGKYTLKAQIENGQNFLKINNACAADDPTKVVFGEHQLHEFTIDTTAAMAMNLIANPTEQGIELTWAQDDYDTLMGYNIYRSTEKDGNYVKLNPSVLLPTDETFLDENAEPGVTYWYTFTVVLSDFTESAPAGKVSCTAYDTLAPSVYHTPVNQGYENNNLVISCTASDNIAISQVTLYYRACGETAWKSLTMFKQNDKYSATVFGSELTLAGLEYYIVATDGNNEVAKGSAEAPYTVIVKEASSLTRLGDVDGDGTITTKDALMIIQSINGDLIMKDDEFQRADLNKDGVLSSVEALRILQYINGNVTTLAMS